jgi:uncharacterized protein YidB (DUF937 family)
MKKKMLILSIAIVAVAAVGLGAFGIANATSVASAAGQNLPALTAGFPDASTGRIFGHGGEGPLHPYVEEATADILGMTADELQAALDDGQRLTDLIEAAGLTVNEFYLALEAALPGIVEQALADEAITEEQAEAILENGLPDRRIWFGVLSPYILDATAEFLGMSAEELQTALDDGTTIEELLDETGLTHLQLRQALDDATPGIVRSALADEAITQEQADQILEYGLPLGSCGGHHRRGGGPGGFGPGGPHGPGGSSGPGGPGMDGLPFLSENG